MRVLVYGAGVIGCALAHMLVKGGADVTLLARGEWKRTIDAHGLVIRHYGRFRTTVDRVKTIEALSRDDVYDLIFVVMQHGQLPNVLPLIAQNHSRYVVLVGNNMDAAGSLSMLMEGSPVPKQVAFGFQGTGGRRERGRVVSVYASVGMTVGGLRAPLPAEFKARIEAALGNSGYRLTEEHNMDAWLKCHLAFILPMAYVCYATGCRLPRATGRQLDLALDAAAEGNAMLKSLGHPIRPDGMEEAFTVGRKKMRRLLWIMAKTPIGKLAASDHCKNAVAEMTALDEVFEALREKAGIPMPAWEALRREGKPSAYAHVRKS